LANLMMELAMLEQLHSKGLLSEEVYKDVRTEVFNDIKNLHMS